MKKIIAVIMSLFVISCNANAAYVICDVNLRNAYGDVVTCINAGEEVNILNTDESGERTYVTYGGYYGTVATIYIADDSDETEIYTGNYHDYSIEISIDNQTIYLLDNGNVIESAPCVTGNYGTRDTPRGTYYIQNMTYGETLSGTDYCVTVNYWIAFNGGIGIHDASWRDDFGGEIYKGNGSHGCVNVPEWMAARIMETCDVGSVVNVY